MSPLPDKFPTLHTIFSKHFSKFLTDQVKSKLFSERLECTLTIKIINIAGKNGLKEDKFVCKGDIHLLLPCIFWLLTYSMDFPKVKKCPHPPFMGWCAIHNCQWPVWSKQATLSNIEKQPKKFSEIPQLFWNLDMPLFFFWRDLFFYSMVQLT